MSKATEQDLALLNNEGLSREEIEEYRVRMIAYLKNHPFNYSGAAATIGFSREVSYAMIRVDVRPFKDLENRFLDELEEKLYKFAMGQLSEMDTFHAPTAKEILGRYRWKRRWLDESQQAKKEPAKDNQSPAGNVDEAAKLLSDYEKRAQPSPGEASVRVQGQGRRIQ